jgi:hypothetical protein
MITDQPRGVFAANVTTPSDVVLPRLVDGPHGPSGAPLTAHFGNLGTTGLVQQFCT